MLTRPSATTMDTRWPAVPTGSRFVAALEKCLSPVFEVILRSKPGVTSNAARPVFAVFVKKYKEIIALEFHIIILGNLQMFIYVCILE